jgi:hypothetical protein
MATLFVKQDDTTYYAMLGKVLPVAVSYEQLGTPGWKVLVGKRSLKDKLSTKEDAAKVALAYAERVLNQCREDLDALKKSVEDSGGKLD